MVDRIHPLKLESPDSGGVETDEFPTSADANEDFVDVRGVAIQSDTSDDEAVLVSRDADGNMTFVDDHVPLVTLTELTQGGFDPGILICTSAGGVVYDSDGHFVVKETP